MEKILVSACLVGDKTRYDGGDNANDFIAELGRHYDLVPFCPEVEGGLKVPRSPAEIHAGSVYTKEGQDVGKAYQSGAEKALGICKYLGIRIAILKDKSPACGPRHIYDGTFTHTLIDGLGVTARLLIANGIRVYAESDALDFLLPSEKKEGRQDEKSPKPSAKTRKRPAYRKDKRSSKGKRLGISDKKTGEGKRFSSKKRFARGDKRNARHEQKRRPYHARETKK